MDSGLYADSDFSVAEPDLPANEFISDCPYQPFGEAQKRDTGVCDNPDTKTPGPISDDIESSEDSPGDAEVDMNRFMLERLLAISKGLPDDPCGPFFHVVCCLGPRFMDVVQRCNIFYGGFNCLKQLGAEIYCCDVVDITGTKPWPYTAKGCL